MSNVEYENNNVTSEIDMQNGMSVMITKVVVVDRHSIEFCIEIHLRDEVYTSQISMKDIRRTKFLQHIPLGDIDETEFYKQLREKILEKNFAEKEILYRTNRNGFQKVNHEWMFVYTNGSINIKGFNPRTYSGIEGYYIPPDAVVDSGEEKRILKILFQEFNHNPKVFYPLFLFNLMAITNGYFREIGEAEFMKLTLWLAGASGSGKTELAKTVGTYIFADRNLSSNAVSATARRDYVLKHLSNSSGSVFFFDDVKKEAVRERKNSVRIKIDDILRSVFSGKLTDVVNARSMPQLIDTCALITGEYMETEESQNARLMYLNADGFLKDQKNSETLRTLQKNPLWLTTICCGFMQWFLAQIEHDDFQSFLAKKLDEMRRAQQRYRSINNAERLNENRNMIEMAYILLEMYFRESGLTEEFIEQCHEAAALGIESLCSNTFSLLGGEQMVVETAMQEIVKKCKIRKARYQNNMRYADGGCKYRQDYFMLHEEDDILFISDYEESLLKNTQGQHEQCDGKPCAIIKEERLMNLLYEGIRRILREYPISCISEDEIISHLPRILKKMQIVYKQHRADGNWGRTAVKYPVCKICVEENGTYNLDGPEKETLCIVEFKPVIQINIDHPYMEILLERLDDLTSEKILKGIDRICDIHRENLSEAEIYKIRKAFMRGKSLHKG